MIAAVRDGMACVLPLPLLSLFTGKEFETMVSLKMASTIAS